jgi:hypothetical protein
MIGAAATRSQICSHARKVEVITGWNFHEDDTVACRGAFRAPLPTLSTGANK